MEPKVKLSKEIVDGLSGFFASEKGAEFVRSIKEAETSKLGTFKMIITTEDIDRVGEMIKADAWELERYMLNPVVLWAHNYAELPVGMTTKLTKLEGGKLEAEGVFAPHERGQVVRQLYEGGYIKTSSVGFIPKVMEGNIITQAELLEWSFVPVPCNPFALSTLSQRGMNVDELVAKGLIVKDVEVKAPVAGDTCQLPDEGGEGVLVEQDGELVCRPKDKPEETEEETDEEKELSDFDKKFAEKFVLESDGPQSIKYLFRINADGTRSIALPEDVKSFVAEMVEADLKEGRVLSKKNATLVAECVATITTAKTALEALLEASGSVDEDSAKGSEGLDGDAGFLALRAAMQSVATVATEVLKGAKVEAQKRGVKTRRSN